MALMGLATGGCQGEKMMSDQERIQGTWQLVSAERNGQPLPEDSLRNVSLVFAGDQLTTKTARGATEARFSLDPNGDPRAIDMDMGTAVGLGIYHLDGDDLKIAHGEVGQPRPSQFGPNEGVSLTLLVLKRATQ
jgi:uncharacterized protein (TIGR03067 family)